MKSIFLIFAILAFIMLCLARTDSGYDISCKLATCYYSIYSTCVKDLVRNTSKLFSSRRQLPKMCGPRTENISRERAPTDHTMKAFECHSCKKEIMKVYNKIKNSSSINEGNGIENYTLAVFRPEKSPHNLRFSAQDVWIVLATILLFVELEQSHNSFSRLRFNPYNRKLWNQLFRFRMHTSWPTTITNYRKLQAYPFTFNLIANDLIHNGRSPDDLMHYEWSRFNTYSNFPFSTPVSPMRLSQAGFYYTGHSDEVRCFSCRVTHRNWREGDDVFRVHRRISPSCALVRNQTTNNIPIHTPQFYTDLNQRFNNDADNDRSQSSLDQDMPESFEQNGHHGNLTTALNASASIMNNTIDGRDTSNQTSGVLASKLKHPEYASVSRREESFRNWPFSDVQNPKTLAKSGLFYTGVKDTVRCFCCGLGLNEWKKEDIPLVEHARLSNACDFLKTKNSHENASVSAKQLKKSDTEKISSQKSGHREGAKTKRSSGAQQLLLAENRALRQQMTCKGCKVRDANTVFLPCGHMITCNDCAAAFNKCSVCGDTVKGTVRVYQS